MKPVLLTDCIYTIKLPTQHVMSSSNYERSKAQDLDWHGTQSAPMYEAIVGHEHHICTQHCRARRIVWAHSAPPPLCRQLLYVHGAANNGVHERVHCRLAFAPEATPSSRFCSSLCKQCASLSTVAHGSMLVSRCLRKQHLEHMRAISWHVHTGH